MTTDDLAEFVFIDEAASNAAMAPRYGRAPSSERAIGKRPGRGERHALTMVGALSSTGVSALMTIEGGMTGAAFLQFVKELLVPTLRPGQVVVMDNLAAHKVKGVREAIKAAGAWVMYLPPYSPDLNPIELCWNKLKESLRRSGARTVRALNQAIANAMKLITPDDSTAWAVHCGYGSSQAQLE